MPDYSIISQAGTVDTKDAAITGALSGIRKGLSGWVAADAKRRSKEREARPIAEQLVLNSQLPKELDSEEVQRALSQTMKPETLSALLRDTLGGNNTLIFSKEQKGIRIGNSPYYVTAPVLSQGRSETERNRAVWSKFKDEVTRSMEGGKSQLDATIESMNSRTTSEIEQIRTYAYGNLTWDNMLINIGKRQGWLTMINNQPTIADPGIQVAREIYGNKSREELQQLLLYDSKSPLQNKFKLGLIVTANNPTATSAIVDKSRTEAEEEQGFLSRSLDWMFGTDEPEQVTSQELPPDIKSSISAYTPAILQSEIDKYDATEDEVLRAIAQIITQNSPELEDFVFNMLKAKI